MSHLSHHPGALLAALVRHAVTTPDTIALEGPASGLSYAGLAEAVGTLAETLLALRPRVVGLLAENGPDWAVADLACLAAGIPLVPLPTFFTAAQHAHAVRQAGVDLLLSDRPDALGTLARAGTPRRLHGSLYLRRLNSAPARLPSGTLKITFTSGTTGTPKGVCLGREAIESVAASLQQASAARPDDRHLALLPLATLLENIGGLYVPLLAGATTRLLPGEQVGLNGSAGVDPARLLTALGTARATSTILVPQLLLALVAALRTGAAQPSALRYVAVGGAPVSPRLLEAATARGLPVFEGYGLSECASVVAVNRPGDNRPGSVGRPLPHVALAIGPGGAIHIGGAGFLGYLGEAPRDGAWVDTGDVGHLDADGRLHITGRRKNMFITAFGRNVAPEWVERELLLQAPIAQAAVFGEGRSSNVAVIVPRGTASQADIDAAIAAANRDLPDYARVGTWIRATTPFNPDNGQLTANGRPRREAIASAYANALTPTHPSDTSKETHGLLC
ncbi:AMP-binding protein [Zoogloea sp.]|uniref:AMP-binding protein n=1 Tax=Zoogloea sp. TaxID=49181 RepID=UPI0035B2B0D9